MRVSTLIMVLAAPFAVAACDGGEEAADITDKSMATQNTPTDSEDIPMMQAEDGGQVASAEGTVTAIDAEGGTITIDHAAVPAVDWPAMTMAFQADEALRRQVAVGDEVEFAFRVSDGGGEITSISKR